jgi:hypothetical protein
MRHSATNTERDRRTSLGERTESQRAGIRALDCGHEPSHDGDLVRERGEGVDAHAQLAGSSSAVGEQRQAV